MLEGLDSIPATAGGGSSNDICKAENCEPSLLGISVEEAGVGGCSGRGIVGDESLVTRSGLMRDAQMCLHVVRLQK